MIDGSKSDNATSRRNRSRFSFRHTFSRASDACNSAANASYRLWSIRLRSAVRDLGKWDTGSCEEIELLIGPSVPPPCTKVCIASQCRLSKSAHRANLLKYARSILLACPTWKNTAVAGSFTETLQRQFHSARLLGQYDAQ